MRFSLNRKMALAVSVLTTTLVAGIVYSVIYYFERQIKEIITSQQYTMVSAVADDVAQKAMTVRSQLQGLAKLAPAEVFTSPGAGMAFLDREAEMHDLFDGGLFLFGPYGELIASNVEGSGIDENEVKLREVLKKTVGERALAISEPFFLKSDRQQPVLLFAVPSIGLSGRLNGVVAGGVNLLNNNFLGKIASIKLGKEGYLSLFNTQKKLIVHRDFKRVLDSAVPTGDNPLFDSAVKGFEGSGETVTTAGLEALVSFRRVKATNWILSGVYPLAEAYEPVYRARNFALVALLLAVILANAVIWRFMRYLTAPLRRLTTHVEAIGEGTPTSPFPVEGQDEIGVLATKFNTMVAELDRRQAAIGEQLNFSKSLLQNAAIPAFVLDLQHRVLIWNHACEELTGVKAEEIIGTTDHWRCFYQSQRPCLADIVLDGSTECLPELYQIYGKSQLVFEGIQAEGWYRLKGADRYISSSAGPVWGANGEKLAVMETLDDITERKQMEKKLQYSQKLEAVGQLAGGVAHDFNNILTAIIGYASIIDLQCSEDLQVKRCAGNIMSTAERGAKLTRGLLAFSRQNTENLEPISLSDLVERVKGLIERDLMPGVELVVKVKDRPLLIQGDSIQLEQMIMNLVSNAKEAMPDGGMLTIDAGCCIIDQEYIASFGVGQPGRFAALKVMDNGIGMDDEIIKRIYEPFFSTKAVGQGTGLGLSLAYGVVKRHKGFIVCNSAPGVGTSFRIFFPLLESGTQSGEEVQS